MNTPEFSEVNISNLERLLELWETLSVTEKTVREYNEHSGNVVRDLGTDTMGVYPYYVDPGQFQEQRDALAEAIGSVIVEERRTRAASIRAAPIKDEEVRKMYQELWTAASVDGDPDGVPIDGRKRYDAEKWKKFQQLLFRHGIVV